jgi:hypothetical protein
MENVTKAVTETSKATKALQKASSDLTKTFEGLHIFVNTVDSLNEEISEKETALASLSEDFQVKLRTANIDFKLRIQENEQETINTALAARGLISMKSSDLAELQSRANITEDNVKTTVADAIASLKAKLQAENESKMQTIISDHKVKVAETNAQIITLKDKVAYLEKALAVAQQTITDEREARVKMAANSSQPVINVGTQK